MGKGWRWLCTVAIWFTWIVEPPFRCLIDGRPNDSSCKSSWKSSILVTHGGKAIYSILSPATGRCSCVARHRLVYRVYETSDQYCSTLKCLVLDFRSWVIFRVSFGGNYSTSITNFVQRFVFCQTTTISSNMNRRFRWKYTTLRKPFNNKILVATEPSSGYQS